MTIQQAIDLALQNQRQESLKPRATSLPPVPAHYAREHVQPSAPSAAIGAEGLNRKVAGGGMAALMIEEQKAREGEFVKAVRMFKFATSLQRRSQESYIHPC
jgi:hypothetical protein